LFMTREPTCTRFLLEKNRSPSPASFNSFTHLSYADAGKTHHHGIDEDVERVFPEYAEHQEACRNGEEYVRDFHLPQTTVQDALNIYYYAGFVHTFFP
jgi:hypothetical protein